MIYTVTLNPSIDYVIKLEHLNTGHVNRVNSENVYPGGKGINVSRILKTLGNDNVATGFVSNFTGDFIKNSLYEQNIKSDFIQLDNGFTRINVKIKSDEELRRVLKTYRLQRSKQDNLQPYMIFNNSTMEELIKIRPKDLYELRNIRGFGETKCEKYGKDLINMII